MSYSEILLSIKSHIENSGLTLQQVADAMGISIKTLKSHLVGKTKPRINHIEKLCLILNVLPSKLLGL